jgi:hypothetical protein
VRWDISLVDGVTDDNDLARTLLDEYYNAPDTVADGVAAMKARFAERGLPVTTNASGTVMQIHPAPADAVG